MKITFIDDEPEIYPLQYGGKARTITNLAQMLREEHDVRILSRSIGSSDSEFVNNGIRYCKLEDYKIVRQIIDAVRDSDVVNVHTCSFTFPFLPDLDTKVFYHLHDVIFATVDAGSHLDKALGNDWSGIIAPSEFSANVLKNIGWWSPISSRVSVVPRSISIEGNNHDDYDIPEMIKERIEKAYPVILFPNRYGCGKGEEFLDGLSKRLKGLFLEPLIVSTAEPTGEIQESKLNIGWVDTNTLRFLYSNSDVTLVPSTLPESFSQVTLESIACGTPVVVTRFGNLQYLADEIPSIYDAKPAIDDIFKKLVESLSDNCINDSKGIVHRTYDPSSIKRKIIQTYNQENQRETKGRAGSRYVWLSPLVATYEDELFFPNLRKLSINPDVREILSCCNCGIEQNNFLSLCLKKGIKQEFYREMLKQGVLYEI